MHEQPRSSRGRFSHPCLCVAVLPVNLPDSGCISICFYFYSLSFFSHRKPLYADFSFFICVSPSSGFLSRLAILFHRGTAQPFAKGALHSRFADAPGPRRAWPGSPQARPPPPPPRGLPRLPAPAGLGIHLSSRALGPWPAGGVRDAVHARQSMKTRPSPRPVSNEAVERAPTTLHATPGTVPAAAARGPGRPAPRPRPAPPRWPALPGGSRTLVSGCRCPTHSGWPNHCFLSQARILAS